MKHLKRIVTLWIVSALIGLLGIVFIIVAVNEVVTSIFGQDQQESNITDDMLDGLPDWITIDMVQAAVSMMNETGYPASVVLGQMILEAGAAGSDLSNPPYYNCLGLKSPSYLETGTVSMITDEAWGTVTGEFSTFSSYTDCMLAWAHRFSRDPYAPYVESCIRDPVTGHYDANAFIQAIWEAGYATDPDYVSKVIEVMTSYDLYKFNNMTNTATSPNEVFDAVMDEALKYNGWPYVYGGSNPDTSFDCSGLVQWCYSKAGISLPRTAQAQYDATQHIPLSQAQPGDLVFFQGTYNAGTYITHVGIYVGNNRMYHAGDPIGYTNLDSSYYQEHLVCAGRVSQ